MAGAVTGQMLLHRLCLPLPPRAGAPLAVQFTRSCANTGAAEGRRRPLPAEGPTLADFMPAGGGCGPGAIASGIGAKRPPALKKPPWLKMYNPYLTTEGAEKYKQVKATIKETGLATVCQEARCPNAGECWSSGTATVMIMGDTCTRACRFCAVSTSRRPPPPDPEEPQKVAHAVKEWGLNYIVLTMVDRDDLADQGVNHVISTVREIKCRKPTLRVETLVGDFQGKLDLVEQLAHCGMEVYAHNIETVERLQGVVRDRRAGYAQTLSVLRHAKACNPKLVTKSSIMLGLGETGEEIRQTMIDLRDAGVEVVTLGQYLQPTKRHMKVDRYVDPAEFDEWKRVGEELGLHLASGPLVRSSYKADELYQARLKRRVGKVDGGSPLELDPLGLSAKAKATETVLGQTAC